MLCFCFLIKKEYLRMYKIKVCLYLLLNVSSIIFILELNKDRWKRIKVSV